MVRISWKRIAVAGALAIAAVAGTGAYWYRPLTVVALQPEQDVAIRVFGLGTMEARVLARIGFKVSGTLTDLRVDHGDRVKAGQLLARMDDREQQARTAKAKAQLSSAEAADTGVRGRRPKGRRRGNPARPGQPAPADAACARSDLGAIRRGCAAQ